jgi:hypothetical protein
MSTAKADIAGIANDGVEGSYRPDGSDLKKLSGPSALSQSVPEKLQAATRREC